MEKDTIRKAIYEANRFMERAALALAADEDKNQWWNGPEFLPQFGERSSLHGYTKESAAMKRASLDLTRALADLRQGR